MSFAEKMNARIAAARGKQGGEKTAGGNVVELPKVPETLPGAALPPLGDVRKEATCARKQAVQDELALAIERINATHFIAHEGGKVRIFIEGHDTELKRPQLGLMGVADFRTLFANQFVISTDSKGNDRRTPLAEVWLQSSNRRQYPNGLALLPGIEAPAGVYNLWRGWGIEPREGDTEPALLHIKYVVCNGDDAIFRYVLRWMAWCIQNPAQQAEVALVLQGKKGTGKGTLGRWMLTIFGTHGLHILHRRHLVGNFNAHLRLTCFAFADEAFFAGDHEGQAVMKGLITEDQITIERKGADAFGVCNRLKIMMATNERWVIPASEDERRYCVLEISDTKRGDHAYFGALDKHMREGGLSALLHHLLNLDLSDFNIRAVPNTEALEKQKLLSLPPLMMWLHERLYEGCFRPSENGWVSEQERDIIAAEFAEFAQRKGGRYVCTDKRTIGEQLRAVFPELGEARKSKGGRRPRLWLFPELDAARALFSKHFGLEHTRWPEGVE